VSTEPALRYDVEGFWDEMIGADGAVRSHYAPLARRLATLSQDEVARRQTAAEFSFQARGITFAVNQGVEGSQAVEKIMPFDLVLPILHAYEDRTIKSGREQ